ncbi:TonB-dependent receptor [Sphingomonas bacterium]|uniref:TonB-dependent receptor n=1 Tax=Sphingomonas bacterium TaxID=1895847 RepID=UPI0020C667BE|nr:TonB-dependent receptor [Sphingomonas bacterium]
MPALAQEAPSHRSQDDVLVVGQRREAALDDTPGSVASVDAAAIATRINAVSIEDTLKYLPSLIVRKRNIGDTQAPIATRTSGLGASARSLIYADGALLSALIGNNNGTASPRWSIISPEEVERIDVLYGPFAAAYPGNSIGAVVNITTRLPQKLEATVTLASNVQTFRFYGDDRVLPTRQVGATIGDRIGAFSFFASYDRVDNLAQALLYVTATPATTKTPPIATTGGVAALNRTAAPIEVIGASAIPQQVQDRFKLKLGLDLGSTELRYVGGLFLNALHARVESYVRDTAAGQPVYAGTYAIAGNTYTLAASAFDGGYYDLDERQWSHSLSATGSAGTIDWQVIGTLYDYAHDVQRMPTGALPAAINGGPGTITRMDGTGWQTFDAKLAWTLGTTVLSAGGHLDRFVLKNDQFATTDWIGGGEGALILQSRGKTRTAAVWAQDAWRIAPPLTLTLGGRYEWWRAYDGVNVSTTTTPMISTVQPPLDAARFSPKATLAYTLAPSLTLRLSAGQAWRFPTVGELYQVVTTPVPAVPNPNLRPERARSEELALEQRDGHGGARLALFNEIVTDALLSQSGALNGTTIVATFVQNVDRTRARGVELSADRTDVVPRIDLSGSVTYADATTRADAAFPAAVGHTLPQVPRWKATLVGTWRPLDGLSLTAAGRYASRMYGTLNNVDIVGNTYQGFYKYLVVDLRAQVRTGRHLTVGLGIDNVNNDRYFLFHPFPQRSFQADLHWTL